MLKQLTFYRTYPDKSKPIHGYLAWLKDVNLFFKNSVFILFKKTFTLVLHLKSHEKKISLTDNTFEKMLPSSTKAYLFACALWLALSKWYYQFFLRDQYHS